MYYYPVLKFISTVNRLVNDDAEKAEHLIMYNTNCHPTDLNDWKDEHYFTKYLKCYLCLEIAAV